MISDASAPHIPRTFDHLDARWFRRLDHVTLGVFDCPHSTPKLTPVGPLVVRTQDIISGVLRTEEAARVTEETYRARIAKAEPTFGDLLYSREGTYFGIAAEVPNGVRVCLGQRMVLIRPDPQQIDHRYLKYWLNSPQIAAHIHGFRDGSVAERLNLPTIRAIPVLVRPMPEQRAIADFLGSLDDKIEQNREMGRALEDFARAMFKAWFVDFEPIKAKAAGVAGFPGMPPAAFAALPHSLSDTAAGPVPTGWPVGTIDDLGVRVLDRVGNDACVHAQPLLDLGRFPARSLMVAATGAADELTTSRVRFEPRDSLFGLVRPYFHKVLLAPFQGITNTSVAVVRAREHYDRCLLALLLSSDEVISHASQVAHGTKMPVAKWSDVSAYPIALPDRPIREAFDQVVSPLLEPLLSLPAEQAMLAKMRDYLLPRLLSGRVRVRPSQAEVEA